MNEALVQQILVQLPILINHAIFSSTRNWLSSVLYLIIRPNHEPSATLAQCGFMDSCYYLGRFLCAIPAGILSDKYGRKCSIIAVGCIHTITWTMLSIIRSVEIIYLIRFFQGSASVLSTMIGINMIGEICSPAYRGFLVSLYECVGMFGYIIECVLASTSHSYSATVYATAALTIIFFPSIPCILESPYHSLSVRDYEKTKRILARIRRGHAENEICAEYDLLRQTVEYEQSLKAERNWFTYLTLRSTRKPVISCALLSILVVGNGSMVIYLYASAIFPPNEYVSNEFYPLIISLIQLCSSMSSSFLIDLLPRRQLGMLSGFLSFIIQSLNGVVYYKYTTVHDNDLKNVLKWIFLMGSILFLVLANGVMWPFNITVRTENLPISIRGLGNSISILCQAVSIIICYQIFNVVNNNYGVAANYVIFAIYSVLLIPTVYYLVPETQGRTLAEVQRTRHEGDVNEDTDEILTIDSSDSSLNAVSN